MHQISGWAREQWEEGQRRRREQHTHGYELYLEASLLAAGAGLRERERLLLRDGLRLLLRGGVRLLHGGHRPNQGVWE